MFYEHLYILKYAVIQPAINIIIKTNKLNSLKLGLGIIITLYKNNEIKIDLFISLYYYFIQ